MIDSRTAFAFSGRQRITPEASVSMAALPRVEGRHRNQALAAARRARAIELRAQGWTYEDIARDLGYANRGTVCHIVSDALRARTDQAVDTLRSLEAQRLDALQVALWDKAMAGDVNAAQAAIRIIVSRCRLLGFYGEGLLDSPEARPRTVVVPPEK